MGLRETLQLVQKVADQYMIDKPYIVGGLPRDIYMKIEAVKTTDIDLTTNSPEVLRLGILLADELNVTFELSDDGHLTVFSDEFDLDFSSHFVSPKVVEYLNGKHKNLEEAFSRDFTINTLHQDLVTEEILDPTGLGFKDIEEKIIRTPVPAEITLSDDPRRAYRAINLAARYNFEVDSEIKKFVIDNPEMFGIGKIKDKYISVKINKALQTNEEVTLKLLKEMNLFKTIPLTGYFKDVLIKNKILVDYLENPALDIKKAFVAKTWEDYVSQGPAYQDLKEWWEQHATEINGNYNPSYQSWQKWYMDKFRKSWDQEHRGPEETLQEMKSDLSWEIPTVFPGLFKKKVKERKKDILQIQDSSKRVPNRAKKYESVAGGQVYVKPGVNITNVTPAVSSFIEAIGQAAAELNVETPIITSGWRSLEEQFKIMGKNWKNNGGRRNGRRYLTNLYGQQFGNAMADIFEQYGTSAKGENLGIQVIQSRPVGSSHILNPGQAIDLAMTSGIKQVLDRVQSQGNFKIKITDETKTAGPHYHVTVQEEISKSARMKARKNQLLIIKRNLCN